MISVKWAIACAERCLHFFEEERPNNNRPRLAIEAAQQWIIDPTINTDHAHAAAHAATNAAATNAATAATNVAADAAYAAAAADSIAAARAATYAARAAARAAAYAAANYSITGLSEQKWSRNKLREYDSSNE